MAIEYEAELGIYARFGLCAYVETMASYGTERVTVQEASEDTVESIILLFHNGHFDILYEHDATCDYSHAVAVSADMDRYKLRLLGPWPDRNHRYKYLHTFIIGEVLLYAQARISDRIRVLDTSTWNDIRAGNVSKVERMIRGAKIDRDTDQLMFPINIVNSHFMLAIIELKAGNIWVYDPLGSNRESSSIAEKIGALFGIILRRQFTSQSWVGPRQGNAYDCGIFVLAVAVTRMKGRPVNELTHIDTVKWRELSWNIILAEWWSLQQRNGIADLHRERGVPFISPEDIDLDCLMQRTEEIDPGQSGDGASYQQGFGSAAQVKSGKAVQRQYLDRREQGMMHQGLSGAEATSAEHTVNAPGAEGTQQKCAGKSKRPQCKRKEAAAAVRGNKVEAPKASGAQQQQGEPKGGPGSQVNTTWWRRGLSVKAISKPDGGLGSARGEVSAHTLGSQYHDPGD